MKKKIFLSSGIFLFVIGVLYLSTNYELVYYPEDQPALPLESLSIVSDGKVETDYSAEQEDIGGVRFGDFVLRKK